MRRLFIFLFVAWLLWPVHAELFAFVREVRAAVAPAVASLNGSSPPPGPTVLLGPRTKTADCRVTPTHLPDRACSPGAVYKGATVARICRPGYSSAVRNVPESEKEAVYREYSIVHHTRGQYEIDHLIPLELGGANDISNLWPEAAYPTPGFREKDVLEGSLHRRVCAGTLALRQAQRLIAQDWLAAYRARP
jgi:hypothetical protein